MHYFCLMLYISVGLRFAHLCLTLPYLARSCLFLASVSIMVSYG